MKTTIILMAAAMTLSAAEPNKPKAGSAPKPNPPVIADNTKAPTTTVAAKPVNFQAGEIGVDVFGVMSRPNLTTGAPTWGTGFGVHYFVTRGLGVQVTGIALEDFSGAAIDEGEVDLLFRAPLWDRIAPFAYVGGIYSFERDDWGAGAGGGLEFALTKNIYLLGRTGIGITTEGRNDWQTRAGIGFRW